MAEHDLAHLRSVWRSGSNQGRDFPVLSDYRALLGGIFRRLYSLDAEQLERVFPRAGALELGIV